MVRKGIDPDWAADIVGKYVLRHLEGGGGGGLTLDFLKEHGYS